MRANIDGRAAGVAAGVYLGVCGDGNDLADQLRTSGGLDGLRAGRPALPGAESESDVDVVVTDRLGRGRYPRLLGVRADRAPDCCRTP